MDIAKEDRMSEKQFGYLSWKIGSFDHTVLPAKWKSNPPPNKTKKDHVDYTTLNFEYWLSQNVDKKTASKIIFLFKNDGDDKAVEILKKLGLPD